MKTNSFSGEERYVSPEAETIQIAPISAVLDGQTSIEPVYCNPPDDEQCWGADEG